MVTQAVVDRPGPAGRLSIIDRTAERRHDRRVSGVSELHLGSQDLIRVAAFSRDLGLQVSRFYLADSHLEPLSREEERLTSNQLVDILGNFGLEELQSALEEDFAGLYVVGVELISRSSGFRLVLRRRGYIDTSVPAEAEALLTLAWRELKLT